ncbi:hypothetical protein Ancab_023045 [Ancistrocladus abbreviatus]
MGAWSLYSSSPSLCLPEAVGEKHSGLYSQNKLVPSASLAGKIQQFDKCRGHDWQERRRSIRQITHEVGLEISHGMRPPGNDLLPKNYDTLVSNMLLCADNGHFCQAQIIWDELVNSSFVPSFQVVSALISAYAKRGCFDQIAEILNQVRWRKFSWLPQVYSLAICCFGRGGKLDLMETGLREMVSMGFPVDSLTGNAYVIYYSMFGSLEDIEAAYDQLKRSRILIEEEGIRAVSFAYLKERKLYRLGEFLRDVGLGRRNVGNLLWNLLLLSYATNFKMKSLQGTFLEMVESGFRPDLTTFNIRALAFSKMSLFWDLHLSLEHMKHENVVPDLVTYGCVVDAYMDKRMGRNLDFAMKKMINLDDPPYLGTYPLVFEVLGKGDFHSSSEAFMEFSKHNRWTYRKLTRIYLKKQCRSNQVFWNY